MESEPAMASIARTLSLKERQRQERQELILRTASELLAERGYHDMLLDEIAARVGISKGTIYLHFPSKEDLVIALFERGFQSFQCMLDEVCEASTSPREKLATIIERATRSMIADSGTQWMSTIAQHPELLARLAERRNQKHDLFDGLRQRITRLIDECKAAGECDPSLPTPLLVTIFTSLLSPHTARRLATEEGMTPEAIADGLSRFFFRGTAACTNAAAPDVARAP